MKTAEDFKNGEVLLIDKPLHWTSFQAVSKIRWAIKKAFGFKKIKVGHAGTLDPLATGLLIICTGKYTKKISDFQNLKKVYTGTFTLGSTTPSFDLETAFDMHFSTAHITPELIEITAKKFIGEIEQKPPIYSAIKKDGKRLYDMAREGKTVEIKSRPVTIYDFKITGITDLEVDFKIECSKGTYIRSLAHDFGMALNSGAHLSALKRTKIGDYSITHATAIESFIAALPSPISKN